MTSEVFGRNDRLLGAVVHLAAQADSGGRQRKEVVASICTKINIELYVVSASVSVKPKAINWIIRYTSELECGSVNHHDRALE